jgi:hypothetical protein
LKSPYGIGGDTYRIGLYDGQLFAYHFYPRSAREQPRWYYHKALNPLFAYNHNGGKGQEMAGLQISIWFLAALSALVPLAWLFRRFVRSRRRTGFDVMLSDATNRANQTGELPRALKRTLRPLFHTRFALRTA